MTSFLATLFYWGFFFIIHLDFISLIGMCVCLIFLWTKKQSFFKKLLIINFLAFLITNISLLGTWGIILLENAVLKPEHLPSSVDGIILLGGSNALFETKERGQPVYNLAGTRLFETIELIRKFSKETKVILTGNAVEAEYTKKTMGSFGIGDEQLIVDANSKRTQDHPEQIKKLISIEGKKFLLVTSAFHMPRALVIFKNAGFDVIPYPVNYLTSGNSTLHQWLSHVLQRLEPMAYKQFCVELAGIVASSA
jgi:uncharacterized SAM-binding protein YcdF (DUF218 family)